MIPTPILRKTALAAALSSLFALPSGAGETVAAPVPLGAEFQANAVTADTEIRPTVAVDADGDFVVAWQRQGADSDRIRARRFDAAGRALGGDLAITAGISQETSASIAMDADGDFVVAYQSLSDSGSDYGIRAQRFNAAGALQGGVLVVNTVLLGDQVNPAVAMDAAGNFVVAWEDRGGADGSGIGIRARRFAADGTPQGNEFGVNTYTTGDQVTPAVAMDADGDFVIAWGGSGPYDDVTISAQSFDARGLAQGGELAVSNDLTGGIQSNPAVAMDADGEFVVAWQSDGERFDPVYNIVAQRFSPAGSPLGDRIVVTNPFVIVSDQTEPAVAMDAAGNVVVSWQSEVGDGDSPGIRARRYDASGTPHGDEVAVNTLTTGNQRLPAVAVDADGDFTVAWQGDSTGGYEVYARRFQGPDSIDLDLFQTDSADPAPVGTPLTYTLSAGNLRVPSTLTGIASIDAAIGRTTGLRVVDLLPAGSTGVSAGGDNWTCTLPSGRVICDYALSLPVGEVASPLVISLTPPSSPGSVISNVARVTAGQRDDNPANNRVVERTRLGCAESVIQLTLSTYTVSETGPSATVIANRSGGLCGAASVQVDTAAGSALAGVDFTDTTGTLTWLDGTGGNRNFVIAINDDALDELDERLAVSLSAVSGARLGSRSAARVVITDNDVAPRINFTARSQGVAESAGLATVMVTLSETSGRDVRVPLNLGGSATAADYLAGSRVLTIPAGSLGASSVLEIVDDALFEQPNETVTFGLGAVSGASVGTVNTLTLTILDDEPPPPTMSFSAASTTGPEGTARSVNVVLSASSAATITVPFAVSYTGSMQAGEFTVSRSSPLTFAPGVTSLGVQINAPDSDTVDEPDEAVVLTLGTPTNATLGATTVHTRTIVDND